MTSIFNTKPDTQWDAVHLQFGSAPNPCLTQAVPHKITKRPKPKGRNDTRTAIMALFESRWYRVHSDKPKNWIVYDGNRLAVTLSGFHYE